MKKEIVILSVGGSLIVPEEIDSDFLKRFKELVLSFKDKRFAIICGGGKVCRKYQEAASKLASLEKIDLDWIGIASTRLNAELVKYVFKGNVHEKVIANPTEKINFNENVLVACGWEPGCSTDADAILLAKNLGIKKIVNLTNIDYVYNKDPKKFMDAVPIKEISWKDLRKILPKDWSPGLNAPFDPIAAKQAESLGIEVAIINGKNLDNLKDYLENKEFVGTSIK